MKPLRTRAQRRALDGLLEKGLIGTAIGAVLLLAPSLLQGSPLVTAITRNMRPVGWGALVLGLGMIGVHTLLRRYVHHTPDETEARVSRFQHSVLPEELLYPPSRVRLEPRLEPAFAPDTEPVSVPAPDTLPVHDTQLAFPRQLPAAAWGPDVFAQIEWRRFEAVCEALFAQAGFGTRAQSHGADGGVDVWLYSRHAQGPVAVMQCKHWLGKAVGVKEMREFLGVMSAHRLKRGTYATSGRYTAEALEFARSNGIHALDGAGLLALIARRTPEQQQALLAVAYDGEYWRPTCASCGIKMVERTPAAGGESFWGCRSFPRCRTTLRMA